MSLLSKYIFDPIKAAAARAKTSMNPVAAAAGAAAVDAVASVESQLPSLNQAASTAANSAIAASSPVVKALEDGLRAALEAAVGKLSGPLAEETVPLADALLTFVEQHGLTYFSSLIDHVRGNIAAAPPQQLPLPGSAQSTVSGSNI